MTEPTEREIKWFVKKLIELRGEIDGYHTSIDFELKDLEEWEKDNKIELPPTELKYRVFFMLNEIKQHYIENNNNPVFAESLKWNEPIGGKISIAGHTTKMLTEYKNWLSLSREARLALNIKPIEKILPIKFRTGGKNFELNTNDGRFKFGNTEGSFGTKTQGFKVLKCLVESRNNLVSYDIICSCLGLRDGVPNRNVITTVLRRIKTKMKILPKRRAVNPDIIINDLNSGYKILED